DAQVGGGRTAEREDAPRHDGGAVDQGARRLRGSRRARRRRVRSPAAPERAAARPARAHGSAQRGRRRYAPPRGRRELVRLCREGEAMSTKKLTLLLVAALGSCKAKSDS